MEPQYYLYTSILLFCIGIFLILTRRNGVMILLGVELLLNAANFNFIGFSPYYSREGQAAAIFIITIAAAEAAIALALLLNAYQSLQTVNIDEMSELRD
ncbi:MAG: NADH-quinone oxidoreductase subunit NuoK [Bacteroidia bacterium]|nr:NADH-quinone oxidoreductase subunit NuoK [Bacteroidia bacterium]